MSQTGNIISVAPGINSLIGGWSVDYTYALDAGGTAQAQILVGFPGGAVAVWASPTSTITVPNNPPGTTNPVVLACPYIVQKTLFGING